MLALIANLTFFTCFFFYFLTFQSRKLVRKVTLQPLTKILQVINDRRDNIKLLLKQEGSNVAKYVDVTGSVELAII